MKPTKSAFTLRLAAQVAALFALIAALGLLVTKVLDDRAPLSGEDGINRALEDDRTQAGDRITSWLSGLASTPVIIGLLIVFVIVFRLVYRRWRESAFLFLAVGTQTLVFLGTALVVDRQRPDVVRLDSSPPTSSFPSGHTGAATALFVGTALVLGWRTRRTWVRPLLVLLAVGLPLAVAYSRLYRGMHHPSDVVASFINGALVVLIWARNVLFGVLPESWARRIDGNTSENGGTQVDAVAESRV